VKKLPIGNTRYGNILVKCEYFKSELVKLDGEKLIEAMLEKFISLTVLKGNGIISAGEAEYSFEERDSIFIPAGEEKYLLRGNAEIIKTTI
jgi:mannose-6-phosphate isomerase class I